MLLYCSLTMLTHRILRNLFWLLIFVHMSYQKQHFPAIIFIPFLSWFFHFALGLSMRYLFTIKFTLDNWKGIVLFMYTFTPV